MGQINIRETGETLLVLQKIAAIEKVNVSEIIRNAIRDALPSWHVKIRDRQRKEIAAATDPLKVETETEKLAHDLRDKNCVSLAAHELFSPKSMALYRFLETIWAQDVGEVTESQREKWIKQLGIKINLKRVSTEPLISDEEIKAGSDSGLESRARRRGKRAT